MPPVTGIDTRYGYTEQIAAVTASTTTSDSGNYGIFGSATTHITKDILHTLGLPNEGAFASPRSANPTQQEQWDYFPFNDRDFTSVAELMLVPGCPPGLFTKQFAEFAPTNATSRPTSSRRSRPNLTPPVIGGAALCRPHAKPAKHARHGNATTSPRSSTPIVTRTRSPTWWTSSSTAGTAGRSRPRTTPPRFSDPTGGRLVQDVRVLRGAQPDDRRGRPGRPGHQLRLARQDIKPGLINLNLIIDEEVFFSVFGKQNRTSTSSS